jgi:hypothetical protein
MLLASVVAIGRPDGVPSRRREGKRASDEGYAICRPATIFVVATSNGGPRIRSMDASVPKLAEVPIGIGFYTAAEAARLVGTPPRNIRRWLTGYSYQGRHMPPLWEPQLPQFEEGLEIGFRDLIELRFVDAFVKAGVGLKAIRNCLSYVRECVRDDRPFSTRRFRTDGRTIFLEGLKQSGESELFDLKRRQFVLPNVIERTFKDLDLEDDAVVRWRPFRGKRSIVIDPERAFGQPIAERYGVPTAVLADAVAAAPTNGWHGSSRFRWRACATPSRSSEA